MKFKGFTFAEVFSSQSNDSRMSAFTLAEVLITLGIIGVVAAMTLPALIQNYQKMVVENQLKVSYSLISNAIKMAEAEYGTGFDIVNAFGDSDLADVNGYSFEFSEAVFEKYFKPYFKITKSYSKSDNNKYFKWRGFRDQTYRSIRFMKCYKLVNGTAMCITSSGNIDSTLYFYVILKPDKTDKVSGRDVFNFTFRKKQRGSYYGYQMMADDYTPGQRTQYLEGCVSPESYPISMYSKEFICTFLIWNNNFKIPDDYPIKF